MPLYYFHLDNHMGGRDDEGCDLADIQAAQCEAAKTIGAMVCDAGIQLWSRTELGMTVTDETGLTLFTLLVAVCDAPALQRTVSMPAHAAPAG